MAEQKALAIKEETIDAVQQKIAHYVGRQELVLPADFSAENALKSAWLILLSATTGKDSGYKPVLTYCDRGSIINALLNMCVNGLSPQKQQGYFIAYGDKLVFQRSYFGTMAVTKRVDSRVGDIYAETIYKGDIFKYKIIKGRKEVTEHEQAFENIDDDNVIGAYCTILDTEGNILRQEVMNIDDIKQAWQQSKMKPIDEKGNIKDGSTHDKFTSEMAKRTVTNRACKPLINSSSDGVLLKRLEDIDAKMIADETAGEEIKAHANTLPIDVDEAIEGSILPADIGIVDAEVVAETKNETKGKPEAAQKVAAAKKAPDKKANTTEEKDDPSWLSTEK